MQYSWTTSPNIVTFNAAAKCMPPLLTQEVKGNELGGTFALELDGYVTDDMAYDASAAVVEEALEDLGSVGAVSVTR